MNILVNLVLISSFVFLLGSHLQFYKKCKTSHRLFLQKNYEETQSKLRGLNSKGQVTSIGILILLLLSIIILAQVFFFLKNYTASKNRLTSYLCLKHNLTSVNQSIEKISKLNALIISGQFLKANPETFALGTTIIKSAQIAQNFIYFSFIKKEFVNNFCTIQGQLFWEKSFPYQTEMGSIKRFSNGIARPKDKEWQFVINSIPPHIAFEHSFSLKINYQPFLPMAGSTHYSCQEKKIGDQLNLKVPYGDL